MLYKLTKIGKVEQPKHPDSDYGDSQPFFIGVVADKPTIGERFNLYSMGGKYKGISTSAVTRIIDDSTFETLNSIYRYEPFNKEI